MIEALSFLIDDLTLLCQTENKATGVDSGSNRKPPNVGKRGLTETQMPEEQPVRLDQQEGVSLLRGVDVFVAKFTLRKEIVNLHPGFAQRSYPIPRSSFPGMGVIPLCSRGLYLFTEGKQPHLSIRSPHQLFLSECFTAGSISIVSVH